MKVQNIALSDYAKQFKSQPYSVLKVAAALIIEDIAFILNDRNEALTVALLCFRITTKEVFSDKIYKDIFSRYGIEPKNYRIINDCIGDSISLQQVVGANKDLPNFKNCIIDLFLCFSFMIYSNINIDQSLSQIAVIGFEKSKQINKAKIIIDSIK